MVDQITGVENDGPNLLLMEQSGLEILRIESNAEKS